MSPKIAHLLGDPVGVIVEHLDGAAGRKPAGPRREHDYPVAEKDGFGDIVGDEDDGLAGVHPDALDQQIHLVARKGVERAERLVHQHDRRIHREAADDRSALLHAARQLAGIFVVEPGKPDALQQGVDPLAIVRHVQMLDLEGQMDVADQRSPGQLVRVLEHHRDLRVRLCDRRPVDQDASLRQGMKSGHQPQQGRLAAAARPKHAHHLARAHVEADALESVHGARAGVVVFGGVLNPQLHAAGSGLHPCVTLRHSGRPNCVLDGRRHPIRSPRCPVRSPLRRR
jgi:hypothetical protein